MKLWAWLTTMNLIILVTDIAIYKSTTKIGCDLILFGISLAFFISQIPKKQR